MAENKKSFLLYADLIHTVQKMPKDKAGDLFLTILRYVNDENPVVEDMVVDLVFEPIKQQLKRDLKKWEDYIEKQKRNGERGGRPPKHKETQKTQPLKEEPKKADNVSVIVNANVTDNVNEILLEEVGSEKVKAIANEVWKDVAWKNNMCIGLSLKEGELKKWLAMFNASVANDKIQKFDKAAYKKMSMGWIFMKKSNGTTVESNGLTQTSNSAPLKNIKHD